VRVLFGCDFSSSPSRRKPIVLALGHMQGDDCVRLGALLRFETLDAWGHWLAATPEWVGGFDFPFGLPRELVESLGWPCEWEALISHYASLDRRELRAQFAAFCAARPAGAKFAHRATDAPAGSSPSMKWVNPPVAFMLHAGIGLLLEAGVQISTLHAGDPDRVALEGYPGLLARELIGRRSYKSDTRAMQTAERRDARLELLRRLERGESRLGLRLVLDAAQRRALMDDGSADRLDAVLCLMQAAWASERPGYGLPDDVDPLEGWIVSAVR